MKVAVCLSGHTRTFLDTYQSVQEHLLSKYDCDCFIHTYHTSGFRTGVNGSDERFLLSGEAVNRVMEIYQPKHIMIEDNDACMTMHNPANYGDRRRIMPETNVRAVLSMFYSIKRSNDLKSRYERDNGFIYDVVMRLRFDDLIKQFDYDITQVQEGFVYVPAIDGLRLDARIGHEQPGWSWHGGLNDQLGFGTSKTMNYYASVYDKIPQFYKNRLCLFHPETMLRKQIERAKLQPCLVSEIQFDLYRGT